MEASDRLTRMTPVSRKILVLGGARSGKSRFAMALAEKMEVPIVFIATARALDSEMKSRIEKHRSERPMHWETREEPVRIAECLKSMGDHPGAALIDCLTIWLSNVLEAYNYEEKKVVDMMGHFIETVSRSSLSLVAVSNEVGAGIVPANPSVRLFRDLSGLLHQKLAEVCDEVYMVTAGIPVQIKGHTP